jgi:hypothetical protein
VHQEEFSTTDHHFSTGSRYILGTDCGENTFSNSCFIVAGVLETRCLAMDCSFIEQLPSSGRFFSHHATLFLIQAAHVKYLTGMLPLFSGLRGQNCQMLLVLLKCQYVSC